MPVPRVDPFAIVATQRDAHATEPEPPQNDMPWAVDALCVDADPEVWFPDNKRSQIDRAKAVCALCPVKAQCRDYAIRNRLPAGVWGGMTGGERKRHAQRLENVAAARAAA